MRSRKRNSPRRTELIPSAKRLVHSLRDIGYDLATAVADLVDNSIAAGATVVRVDTQFAGANSWIRITDNGTGMTEKRLTEAMRFGTRRDYGHEELGKFGLGLKSASLSQCRRFTVATRTTLKTPIRVAQWDIDHVETTDRWEVLRPGLRRVSAEAVAPLRRRRGTVVLWEMLDRVFRYRVQDGLRALDGFDEASHEVEEHLEMVFHRFLDGTARRRRPLAIYLNARQLQPWDPFARAEPATFRLAKQVLHLSHDGANHVIAIEPFVLPTEAAFSSGTAHRRASGPRKWNRQQGFYFYRNDRMIQSGGWNRLRTTDEHVKLARVSVDFSAAVDSAFELNVSKTQVRIPTPLRSEFSALASSVAQIAQNAYRRPSAGYEMAGGSPDGDPRVHAISELVTMIVDAVFQLIAGELDQQPAVRDRLLDRIRAMQQSFSDDLYVAVASNGHASPNGSSTVADRDFKATIAG